MKQNSSTISQSSVFGHMSLLVYHPHFVSELPSRTPESPRFDDARDAKTYMDYPGIREAAALVNPLLYIYNYIYLVKL